MVFGSFPPAERYEWRDRANRAPLAAPEAGTRCGYGNATGLEDA
jgi:hypothetical protein